MLLANQANVENRSNNDVVIPWPKLVPAYGRPSSPYLKYYPTGFPFEAIHYRFPVEVLHAEFDFDMELKAVIDDIKDFMHTSVVEGDYFVNDDRIVMFMDNEVLCMCDDVFTEHKHLYDPELNWHYVEWRFYDDKWNLELQNSLIQRLNAGIRRHLIPEVLNFVIALDEAGFLDFIRR